jgi:hypothetical protein
VKAIVAIVALFATAAAAFAQEIKPSLPPFVADLLTADSARNFLINIQIAPDGQMVTSQFRNSIIRNTSLISQTFHGGLAEWFNPEWYRIVSSDPVSLLLEERTSVAGFKRDPKRLTRIQAVRISDKRMSLSVRVPFSTLHKCGIEQHNVWLTGIVDYSAEPPEGEVISASLITMIYNDGLHYFVDEAEEKEFCAKIELEEAVKKAAAEGAPEPADESIRLGRVPVQAK